MLLKIKNLKLQTVIGVHSWEAEINREIIINVEIESDLPKAVKTDEIIDTIDYDLLVCKIKNLIATKRFKLVEKMAQEILQEVMQDQRIKRCKLEIDKVKPIENLQSFSVTVEKNR
jgi:dihydroneopterin aldolase